MLVSFCLTLEWLRLVCSLDILACTPACGVRLRTEGPDTSAKAHILIIIRFLGAGKSVLLREIIKTLKKKYNKAADAVAVTASTGDAFHESSRCGVLMVFTGIAACNVGGVTVHSFAGIGIGADNREGLLSKVKKNKKAMTRWLRTRVLIIDEGRGLSFLRYGTSLRLVCSVYG